MSATRTTRRCIGLATLASAAAMLLSAFAAAPAHAALGNTIFDFSFGGGTGTGSGQFNLPAGMAINDDTGDIYVTDRTLHRVSKFDSDGNFILMWGRGVNQSTGGDVCPVDPGDVCQGGSSGSEEGWFNGPQGIGVDDDSGDVYVQDAGNNRVQRFTADGEFILTWGKAVNGQSGGDLCPEPGQTTFSCAAGQASGVPGDDDVFPPIPPVPSEDGVFPDWDQGELSGNGVPNLTVDDAGNIYTVEDAAVPDPRIQKFDANGAFLGKASPSPEFFGELTITRKPVSPTVNADGDVYLVDGHNIHGRILRWSAADFTQDGDSPARQSIGTLDQFHMRIAIDQHNQYIVAVAQNCKLSPGDTTTRIVEYHPSGQEVDCTAPAQLAGTELEHPAFSDLTAMATTSGRKLYVADKLSDQIHVFTTPTASPPEVRSQSTSEITTSDVRINVGIAANLDDTTFHVEYGPAPCSNVPNPCTATEESGSIGASFAEVQESRLISGLEPDTAHHYRVVATSGTGSSAGPDRLFRTYPPPEFDPSCENNLARQQTGAAFLLDCRAYELVSAEDQGGYNVASDLVSGQQPYGGFPRAEDRALYAVHNGGIPGTGNPTNRGPDPYLATRDAENERWNTEYVGIPATVPSLQPFSSTVAGTDSSLSSFAFGGPEICNPCLPNGSSGIPLRLPDGSLVQGMVGSQIQVLDPEHTGEVKKPLSADGTNFVFASKQQFVPGANNNGTDTTFYNRDLETGITRIASVRSNGSLIQAGENGVVQLDLSADGSRTLIGEVLGTDAEGNRLWHLYMHTPAGSKDVTPGTTTGALYAGMSDAGTRVYFTTPDPLVGDSDTSSDLYLASVGSSPVASLSRVSDGDVAGNTDACDPAANSYNTEDWNVIPGGPTDCSVVPIGGQGGVARGNGTVYFLSPERLGDDSEGVDGAPNLYHARPGADPVFVETLESSENEPLADPEHLFQRSYGSFSYPEGVAIDSDDGSVYVLDTIATSGADTDDDGSPNFDPAGFVQRLDASGEPDLTFADNSKLSESQPGDPFRQSGVSNPVGQATQIAVDNSNSIAAGTLYVPDYANNSVHKFDSSGSPKGSLGLGQDRPTGVAVNPSNGDVFVTSSLLGLANKVHRFNAAGFSLGTFGISAGPALGVAVDAAGNFYVVNGEDTRVYDSSGTLIEVFHDSPSFGVAIDPADGHVYIDEGDRVSEFDSSGTLIDNSLGLGRIEDSVSLAVDSGRVVVSNPSRGNVASYSAPATPPDSRYDSPIALNALRDPETRHTADFQTTPDGDYATFPSGRSITGFDNAGHYQVFRHDVSGAATVCVSCNQTNATPTSDAGLASNGLSITDDGRVFFNTGEPLVLRDANSRRDAYEWSEEEDRAELISSGQDPFDSGLLSVSADGTDAFFFTRETLTENDGNGNLTKLYTAREDGGFFKIPPEPPCRASDECHGPGSEPAPPVDLGTLRGSGGNAPQPKAKDDTRCNTRKLARRARGFSRRAKLLRRRAVRSSNRRAGRRMRLRSRRFARGARKNATAAKRCRARTRARRARR